MTESYVAPSGLNGKALIPFDFEGKAVRVTDRQGNPWFVLADICRILGLDNPSKAAMGLDEDEKYTLTSPEGIADRRVQSLVIVSESGAYALTFKSRKPEARRLRKFVTKEVLPSIRRTGSFSIHGAVPGIDPATLEAALERVMPRILSCMTDQLAEAKIAADRRVAVLEFRSTLEILKEYGVPQEGRRGFVRSMTSSLHNFCSDEGLVTKRCPRTGTRLYPADIVPKWWRMVGRIKLQEWLTKRTKPEAKLEQGSLKLVVENEKPKKGAA